MLERRQYFTADPHPSVLEEHDVYVSDDVQEAVKEIENVIHEIVRKRSLPRWKRMAKAAIDGFIFWGEEQARIYGADSYIIPQK